ncbi:MAG: 8-amino-7-oxononanoate synthase [Bacteroidales bacterium]|nr:8-amino-7-oxononanoate synthase [Bacteroidales bacterium]
MDLTSNDYLAIGADRRLVDEFFASIDTDDVYLSSCASRLLSERQNDFNRLESLLADLYSKSILVYNSGYHANTGTIAAVADKQTLIVADRLVHASIIDGIILSRAPFLRFRHNDIDHLEQIVEANHSRYDNILIVVESIYSMDGDICDLDRVADIRRRYPNTMLYVDEAHAIGVAGRLGLGISEQLGIIEKIDFLVGTLGKAVASQGAFVATSPLMKDFLINRSRSFIFSTAIPPISCKWSAFVVERITRMQSQRSHLAEISKYLNEGLADINGRTISDSQIVPLMAGSNSRALELSAQLKALGYLALPIRKPTVPEGLERVRISLNASLDFDTVKRLLADIKRIV